MTEYPSARRSAPVLREPEYLRWVALAIATVVVLVVVVWQPWNASLRQAQAASEAYSTAHTDLLGCAEQSSPSTVATCWTTFASAVSSINWPPVLNSDVTDLVNAADGVAASENGSGSFESASVKEGAAENRLETDLSQLIGSG